MPMWNHMFLQDSCSPLAGYITSFHDHMMVVVIMIISFILYSIVGIVMLKSTNRFLLGEEFLEVVWTIVPSVILGFVAIPSLRILYSIEEMFDPLLTVKVIGHQWYWSYMYFDTFSSNVSFDSYMLPSGEGDFRLLEVDHNTILPFKEEIRMIITSDDVIHSWTIPSIGVKVDAVPGRLNQLFFFSSKLGSMYGQCSEICGTLHSFMPICVEIVPLMFYYKWFIYFIL